MCRCQPDYYPDICGISAAGRMPGCLTLTLPTCDSFNNEILAGEGGTMYICLSILLNNRKPQNCDGTHE